jgi:hypothetical protein
MDFFCFHLIYHQRMFAYKIVLVKNLHALLLTVAMFVLDLQTACICSCDVVSNLHVVFPTVAVLLTNLYSVRDKSPRSIFLTVAVFVTNLQIAYFLLLQCS